MTRRINLLDWRAARRARLKQQFTALLGLSFVVSAVLVALVYTTVSSAVSGQQARNEYLQQQIAETEQKIKEIEELEKVKANLLSRMRVIEQLQASRSASVHFFDELVNTLPDGVSLRSIKEQGNEVTIDGVAESNGRVSTYMKNLEASPWFEDARLVVIQTKDQDRQRRGDFQLKVRALTTPNETGETASSEVLE